MKTLNPKLKPSILTQLLTLIVITIIVPFTLLAITSYRAYVDNIKDTIVSHNFQIIEQTNENITNITQSISSIINIFNNDSAYEELLTRRYENPSQHLNTTYTIEQNLDALLANMNLINIDIILVGDNELIYSTSTNPYKTSVKNIYRTYWYQDTETNPELINWFRFNRSYFTRNKNRHMIVATKNLKNNVTGRSYGTIIIEISEDFLFNRYKKTVKDSEIFMIHNSVGELITTSDRSELLLQSAQSSNLVLENSDALMNYKYKGHEYLYLSQTSPISDWKFIKLISMDTVNDAVRNLGLKFIAIYSICIILLVIGVIALIHSINKPIKKLSHRIHDNFLYTPAYIHSNKPSNQTFSSYEDLVDEVDEAIDQLLSTQKAKLEAELYALKMQINPHFLYNTLNSIKSLVWTNKVKYIEPTITSLVKVLRQTLQNSMALITLEEEIELLKHYIYIQNIRTEQSIKTEFNINVNDLSIKVPSLILQPIVENAIFHGIEPLGNQGIINISSMQIGDDLIIEVFDNGVGMPQDKIATLLTPQKKRKHHGLNGIGLSNIQQRLVLNYGETYGLKINSTCGVGTSVTITLKAIREVSTNEFNDSR